MILTLEITGPQAEKLGAIRRKVFNATGGTIGLVMLSGVGDSGDNAIVRLIGRASQSPPSGDISRTAMLPAFMLVCYLGMLFYFRSRGGYRPKELGSGH